jgi:hypothetical protein
MISQKGKENKEYENQIWIYIFLKHGTEHEHHWRTWNFEHHMGRRQKVIDKEGKVNGVERYLSYLFHKKISMNTEKRKKEDEKTKQFYFLRRKV